MSNNESRKLTEAEKRRLIIFNDNCEALNKEGYIKDDLVVNPLKANTLGALYGFILAIPFIVIYFIFNSKGSFKSDDNFFVKYLIFIVLLFVLIVVHELIHGFTWSRFTDNGFKDIEFGVILKSLNPYCTCKKPMRRNEYLWGLLMPCVVLGFIPSIISWFNHSFWFLAMGAIMIISAGGDLLIAKLIFKNKTNKDSYYLDHPTDIGLVVFKK